MLAVRDKEEQVYFVALGYWRDKAKNKNDELHALRKKAARLA